MTIPALLRYRRTYPLYTGLLTGLAAAIVLAVLMYWGSIEIVQQAESMLTTMSSACSDPAAPRATCDTLLTSGELAQSRSSVIMGLQAVYLILLLIGAGFLAFKSRELLVQRSQAALSLTHLRRTSQDHDEIQRMADAICILAARQTGMEAEGRWQQKISAEHLRSHREELRTLHDIARMFSESDISEQSLRNALARLEAMLGARTLALCLHDTARQALNTSAMLTTHGTPALIDHLDTESGMKQVRGRIVPPHEHCKAYSLVVSLCKGETDVGTLVVEFPPDTTADPPNLPIAECFAHLAALAISALSRSQEERRVALLEERNAIAGELHDSLAQSLAFMKIQVAQLQRGLEGRTLPVEVSQAARELREGLATAYREVRELIAAFRVRMGSEGLIVTITDTIEEFSQRGGLDIHFSNRLGRCQLEINEEFHVMQVIRESLSNVVRHARASNVWIELRYDPSHLLTVHIEDDGLGVGDTRPSTKQHYGLSIMNERARSLGGKLAVYPRPGGGTHVELGFAPLRVPVDAAVDTAR